MKESMKISQRFSYFSGGASPLHRLSIALQLKYRVAAAFRDNLYFKRKREINMRVKAAEETGLELSFEPK